jgi:hypothetical protein
MKKIIPNPSPKTNKSIIFFYCKAILFVLGLEFGIIFFYCKAILFVLGLEFGIIFFYCKAILLKK